MLALSQMMTLNDALVNFLEYIMTHYGSYKERIMLDVDKLFEYTYESSASTQKLPNLEDVDEFIKSCFIKDNGSYQLHVVRTYEGHVGILIEESDYAIAKAYF